MNETEDRVAFPDAKRVKTGTPIPPMLRRAMAMANEYSFTPIFDLPEIFEEAQKWPNLLLDSIHGFVPEVLQLSGVNTIYLKTLSAPADIFYLPNLRFVTMQKVELFPGKNGFRKPPTNVVKSMDIHFCKTTGTDFFDAFVGDLWKLEVLDVRCLNDNLCIPDWLPMITRLRHFLISRCSLKGVRILEKISTLQSLGFEYVKFRGRGSFMFSWETMINLAVLTLVNNSGIGPFGYGEFKRAPNLKFLTLFQHNYSHVLPTRGEPGAPLWLMGVYLQFRFLHATRRVVIKTNGTIRPPLQAVHMYELENAFSAERSAYGNFIGPTIRKQFSVFKALKPLIRAPWIRLAIVKMAFH